MVKYVRSIIIIGLGLVAIASFLYLGRRNQLGPSDQANNAVPSGSPLDFSQQRCEDILYGASYSNQRIIHPDVEIEPKPKDQISFPISETVVYRLWFSYQGYHYQKECAEPLNMLHTNVDQWHLVKGQWFNGFSAMGYKLFSDAFTHPYTGFALAENPHEHLFTLETELAMIDALEPDRNEHAAGLVFRVPALANPEQATGYGVVLTTKGPTDQPAVKLFTFDSAATIIKLVPLEVQTGQLYQLKVAVSPAPDPRIKVWVDGNLMIDVADPDPNTIGYAGFMVNNEVADFDHIYLYNQGSPLAASAVQTNLTAPWVKLPLTDPWLEIADTVRGTGAGDSFYIADSNTANGQLSADIQFDPEQQPATAALLFRIQDKLAPTNGSYGVGISTIDGGELKLFKFPYQPIQIVKTLIVPNQSYKLQVEFIGPYLKVLLNGQTVIDYTMDSSYIEGFVGLSVYNSTASFKNIQLTQPPLIENFATNLAEPWQVSDLVWPVNALAAQKIKRGLLVSAIDNGFYLSNTPTPDQFMFESEILLVADPAQEQATAGLVMFSESRDTSESTDTATKEALIVYMSSNNGGELGLFEYPDPKGGLVRYADVPLARCQLPIHKDVVYKLKVIYDEYDRITISLDGQACLSHPLAKQYHGGYFGLAMREGNALFNNTFVLTPLN
ncbi:family 16 glycoside hydrolase [Herpetosiphon gulosus]|uniref:3-keto-alpha-glucoside-1,2-lyase/3-keto-2-hydroxy-glucal hydratase domain-containing protein n=1 Tax=Herpetosiphon gulosus TaxID=1973496 RepID=A0ABP9X7Z2_9CHLR